MFIQTEATPNPATLKFLPGRPVLDEGTFEALDDAQAERSPLAQGADGNCPASAAYSSRRISFR